MKDPLLKYMGGENVEFGCKGCTLSSPLSSDQLCNFTKCFFNCDAQMKSIISTLIYTHET